MTVTPRAAPFRKEPPAARGKVIRGVLNFSGSRSNSLAFIWQRDTGKLFLDLNRNQDLTDDPAGAHSATASGAGRYASFASVHLPVRAALGEAEVVADVSLWDYGSEPGCSVMVRSFWQGKLTLQARDSQVVLIQNAINDEGSFETGLLLLRAWDDRNRPFDAFGDSLELIPYSKKLFVNGHAYELDLAPGVPNGKSKPALHFMERTVALGEVKITGQYIRRILLSGGPWVVAMDEPASLLKIPVGNYDPPKLLLEKDGVRASYKSGGSHPNGRLSVSAAKQTVLALGGPLTNSVSVTRHGRDLNLSYQLVGVGGEVYQPTAQDRSKPPQFAVYSAGKRIASGSFEFG